MNYFFLAWRNLWRRRRRTLITLASIGFGLFLAVTFTGTGDYFYTRMIDSGATMGMGHVTIEARGYNQAPTLDKRLRGATALRNQVLDIEGVRDVRVRIFGQAMYASANKTVGGGFIAIDPGTESAEFNLLLKGLVSGRALRDSRETGIVIGEGMAENLGVGIGNKLVYTTTDVNGEIVSNIARVAGIFSTGVKDIDNSMSLLPIDRVREMLSYAPDDASLLAIMLADQRRASTLRDQLARRLASPEREFLVWNETQPDLSGLIALDRSTNYLSQVLIGVLIAAGIFNTMLMSVLERRREFGIMMALGMGPAALFVLVMTEAFWVALLGLISGTLLTAPWYYFLATAGLDLRGLIGDDYNAGGVIIEPLLKIALYGESALIIVASVFLLSFLASLYPAWRAGRIMPAETLRAL